MRLIKLGLQSPNPTAIILQNQLITSKNIVNLANNIDTGSFSFVVSRIYDF